MEKSQTLLNFFQKVISQTLTQNFFFPFFHSGLNSVRCLCFHKPLATNNSSQNSQTWPGTALRTFTKVTPAFWALLSEATTLTEKSQTNCSLIEISENWMLADELETQFFQTLEFHLDVDLLGSCMWAGLLRKHWPWARKPGFGPCSAPC